MNKLLLSTALGAALIALPAVAQDNLTSTSGSGAEANSGSVSGASSDNANANVQNGNIGVSRNDNTSTSNSGAVSGSESDSRSLSNSDQGQAQDQLQGQTQSNDSDLSTSQTNQQGQQAVNQQGVTVSNAFNYAAPLRRTYVGTNNAVPLAASSSFSSDYCGGTASVGASVAPIGVSIGGNKPIFDKSCQSLRRAEKFGMASANAYNMQQPELAGRLMSMMIWSICTSDSQGAGGDETTALACAQAGLLEGPGGPPVQATAYIPPPPPQPPVTPEFTAPPTGTYSDVPPNDDLYKTPRGDADDGTDEPLAEGQQRVQPLAAAEMPLPTYAMAGQ